MSDLTQGIERGVADFAGSDDNNNNNSNQRQGDESMARPDGNNDESGLRNEERALTGQSSGFGFGAGAGAGAGGGGMEGTADKYVNKGVYGTVTGFW